MAYGSAGRGGIGVGFVAYCLSGGHEDFTMQSILRSILILAAAVAANPAAMTFAQSAQFRPGDRVTVVPESAELTVGTKVVAKLSKGQQLRVKEVRDRWVGCVLEVDGQEKTGWIASRLLATAPAEAIAKGAERKKEASRSEVRPLAGGDGPRVADIEGAIRDITIIEMFVFTEGSYYADSQAPGTFPNISKSPEPFPASFPSGTKRLDFVARFDKFPSSLREITFEVSSGTKTIRTNAKKFIFARDGEKRHNWITSIGPLNGPFPDGDYRAKVRFDGVDVALLTWTIGSA